jgi:hypothetical protein
VKLQPAAISTISIKAAIPIKGGAAHASFDSQEIVDFMVYTPVIRGKPNLFGPLTDQPDSLYGVRVRRVPKPSARIKDASKEVLQECRNPFTATPSEELGTAGEHALIKTL